ncbi:MAG: methyltransferase [Xanthobacteraceae bacterium]
MSEAGSGVTEDAFLGGRLRLRQPVSGHRAGHDAILLAAATAARPGQRIAEFGAGVGAAGLAVARRVTGLELVLVEINAELAALASANAAANGIGARVLTLDLAANAAAFAAAGLDPDSVDGVLMNPPFNDPVRQQASPDTDRRVAHEATTTTLEGWTHAARRVLKPSGTLTLIWRAEGLADVLACLARGFGSVAVQPVHGKTGAPAIRILVRAIKGGRAPLRIYPGLMLNEAAGVPTEQASELLSGEAISPLGAL